MTTIARQTLSTLEVPDHASNADSGEDDLDVVLPKLSFTTNTKNSIVSTFLRNRRMLDPAWTQAAESVFSESHPFHATRKNRSQEQQTHEVETQNDPSPRSSSESRCSSPTTVQPEQEETVEKRLCCDNDTGKSEEIEPTTADVLPLTEPEIIKSDSPKSSDERKQGHAGHAAKKKRASLSMVRQRHASFLNAERLLLLKAKVEAAIREHKVYSMTGHYWSVRKALKQRGWVEKIDSDLKGRRRTYTSRFDDAADDTCFNVTGKNETGGKERGEQFEAEIVNRMLRNIPEDLCWLSKPYPYCWRDMNKCDMVNRLPKAYFSNKVGLANSLAHMQWYYEEGVCCTQYPRTYNISMRDEYQAFQDDFRLTACVSTLKWLALGYRQGGEGAVRSPDGRVDANVLDFALRRCTEYIQYRQHDDIDCVEMPHTWDHQWDHFLTQYYKLVNDNHVLREAKEDPPVGVLVGNAQAMLGQLRPFWPQMDMEGTCNWWIVKPGGRCCGNGILIRNHLDHITNIVSPSVTRETRYVVQKYIEKPLLIYNTKFDIRQWFLVTNVYPLTIWMYKESYLRFCSSNFSLRNAHESIHLCNNAVQRRYKNGKRDRNLPDENMWDCYTFQTYLKAIGHPNAWEDVIYPGMRESFVGALLASQDSMERRRNCFELYGADFMVTETITDGPWLIEINSNPAMDSSTSVTARMCPQVLEDIIKVVVDRRNDKNASTGAFELAYKQNCPPIPPYLGMSLSIRGKKVYKSPSEAKKLKKPYVHQPSSDSDDCSLSESEENPVQKRCATDFMQPIKTLREEIEMLGRSRLRQDLLSVRNAHLSDSAANDTDTSRGSMDRRMTLEGKEIELKRKKNRKKRHKVFQRSEVKSRTVTEKRQVVPPKKKHDVTVEQKTEADKKTDYVKKNIKCIRGYNVAKLSEKPPQLDDEGNKFLAKSQENLDIYKDYIFSGQCLEEYKSNHKNSHHVLEALFRQQMKKMMVQQSDEPDDNMRCPIIVTGLWEPQGSEREDETARVQREAATPRKDLLRVECLGPSSRTNSSSSLSFDSNSQGDLSDCDFLVSAKSNTHYGYDLRLRPSEGNEIRVKNRKWPEGDFTQALSITAPDLMVKQRSKQNRWQATKASIEYFREWKFKIDETRRNCEDMLTKLKNFKENNSKIKFQDILQRRLEEETRKMKRMRTTKTWENAAKSCGLRGKAKQTARWQRDGKTQQGALAISTATGAVVHVSDGLPKIKLPPQRTSPVKTSLRKECL